MSADLSVRKTAICRSVHRKNLPGSSSISSKAAAAAERTGPAEFESCQITSQCLILFDSARVKHPMPDWEAKDNAVNIRTIKMIAVINEQQALS